MGSIPELERRLLLASSDAERLPALLELAREHSAAFRNREGLRAAREALTIARRANDTLHVGRALAVATLCHYQRGDYVSAVATGVDAVEACADGDISSRSRALQSIALALFSVESFELAEKAAERSVTDARVSGDREREAYACNVYGAILGDLGRYNRARRQFRVAAGYYRVAGDLQRLKKAASNLGHTYRKQGVASADEPRLARMYWTHALRVYRIALASSRHDPDDAIILGSISECECRLGQVEEAYADVGRALDLVRKSPNPAVLANCHLWEGYILQKLGEIHGAQRAFERACEAAATLEHDPVRVTCLQALASLLRARGEEARARELEKRADECAWERSAFLAEVRDQLGSVWRPLDKIGM
ncbi:MAG TPA: hypothetical protein VM073_06965 [Usitatibacter sp.]|nr:hypothetical protein [Usitatibacter sp.]